MNVDYSNYWIWPHYFFFQVLPYVVASVFFLGCFVRLLVAPYTWKSQSSEFLNKKGMFWSSNLFHIGILLLLAGHFVGLFFPAPWYDLIGITPPVHQMIELIAGAIAATICILGFLGFVGRRLFSRRVRVNSRWSDWWVLLILALALGFGVNILIWGGIYDSSGAQIVNAGDYVRDLFSFYSDAWTYTLTMPIWLKLHMEFGLLVFLCVPFTRLVHAWSGIFTPFYLFRPMQIMRIGLWSDK